MVYNKGMSDANTITVKRNNDRGLPITVKKDGVAKDISGWTIKLSVKENQNDPDSEAIINATATIDDGPGGLASFEIAAADTADKAVGPYYYDILALDSEGKRQSSKTGAFELVQEITDGS